MSSASDEREFWERGAATHAAAISNIFGHESAWSGTLLEECLMEILPFMPNSGSILDLGCGIGRLTVPVAQRLPGAHLIGLDISPRMLAHATLADVTHSIQWVLGDGRGLPHEIEQLDGAFSMIVLQHVPIDAQCAYIEQVAQRLRRGGCFRFQVLKKDKDEGPLFLVNATDMQTLAACCDKAQLDVTETKTVPPMAGAEPGVWWVWFTAVKR